MILPPPTLLAGSVPDMNQTDRPEVSNGISAIFFGQENNACRGDDPKISRGQLREIIDDAQQIKLDGFPPGADEGNGESIVFS